MLQFRLAALAVLLLGLTFGLRQAPARQPQNPYLPTTLILSVEQALVGNNPNNDWAFVDPVDVTVEKSGGKQFQLRTWKYKGKSAYQETFSGVAWYATGTDAQGLPFGHWFILVDIVSIDVNFPNAPPWTKDATSEQVVDDEKGTYNPDGTKWGKWNVTGINKYAASVPVND